MTTFPNPEVARRRPLAVTVTAWVALLGLVVAAVGAVVLLLPLSTPTQNCGTSAGFLLDGRVNVFVDPEAPPAGITKADALDNNAKPCQERAANRARPAGIAVVGGALIGGRPPRAGQVSAS